MRGRSVDKGTCRCERESPACWPPALLQAQREQNTFCAVLVTYTRMRAHICTLIQTCAHALPSLGSNEKKDITRPFRRGRLQTEQSRAHPPLSSEMTWTSSYSSAGSDSRLCFDIALWITAGVLSWLVNCKDNKHICSELSSRFLSS